MRFAWAGPRSVRRWCTSFAVVTVPDIACKWPRHRRPQQSGAAGRPDEATRTLLSPAMTIYAGGAAPVPRPGPLNAERLHRKNAATAIAQERRLAVRHGIANNFAWGAMGKRGRAHCEQIALCGRTICRSAVYAAPYLALGAACRRTEVRVVLVTACVGLSRRASLPWGPHTRGIASVPPVGKRGGWMSRGVEEQRKSSAYGARAQCRHSPEALGRVPAS